MLTCIKIGSKYCMHFKNVYFICYQWERLPLTDFVVPIMYIIFSDKKCLLFMFISTYVYFSEWLQIPYFLSGIHYASITEFWNTDLGMKQGWSLLRYNTTSSQPDEFHFPLFRQSVAPRFGIYMGESHNKWKSRKRLHTGTRVEPCYRKTVGAYRAMTLQSWTLCRSLL